MVALLVWTGEVAAAGATEDYDFRFHTYPNPFTPGYGEASFYYVLPAGGVASAYVYDLRGELVRTVFEGAKRIRGESRGEDRWDGLDDAGAVVRPGAYIIYLEVVVEGTRYRDSFVAIVNR